jgi:transposase
MLALTPIERTALLGLATLPDLALIENLWAIMKQEIYKLYPDLEYAPDTADTLKWLIHAVKEAWNNIDN